MKSSTFSTAAWRAVFFIMGMLAVSLVWPFGSLAQDKAPDPARHKHADKDLAVQVRDLQAKIAKLEAALKQGHKGTPSGAPDTGGMAAMPMGMGTKKMGKGMAGMMGMEEMDRDEMKMMRMMRMMGGMKSMGGGMGMMDMDMDEMLGMMGMGSMGQGMAKMKMASSLPGFPGASHIYHIGATGFFLDHPEHAMLTTKQQITLNGLKEKALLGKSSSQRKIYEAEQELWTLTASDQPDAAPIEAKVREIEKLRGNQRLAFIRAVGEAARVLADEQRKALLGTADKAGKHSGH